MTVYFIRSDCGRVKVGFTDSATPDDRLRSLQTGSPRKLECISYCPGSVVDERAVHRYLEKDRVHLEWFEPSDRLANVLHFADKFRSLNGFEKALAEPEAFALFVSRYGTVARIESFDGMPPSDIRWSLALERFQGEGLPQEPVVTTNWFYTWEQASIRSKPDSYFIEHTSLEYTGDEPRAEWWDGQWTFSSGLRETANALWENVMNPRKAAAVWVLACIQDLTYSRADPRLPQLDHQVPGVFALKDELRTVISLCWHRASTRALPYSLRLPERCLLTNDEFVEACARHRRMIVRETRVQLTWAEGASTRIAFYKERAAA